LELLPLELPAFFPERFLEDVSFEALPVFVFVCATAGFVEWGTAAVS
jgi:hypothetical protein